MPQHLNTETTAAEIERLCAPHAPLALSGGQRPAISPRVRKAIESTAPIEAVILTADIRRSAAILKESIDAGEYAHVLTDFVAEFRTVLSYHGGWYDKFTGDGFICYWLPDNKLVATLHTVLSFSCAVMENFKSYYCAAFCANLRNIPTNIGLSIGIDAGPCYLAPVAGNLTLIGSPIVGSVRMANNTAPYHLNLNAYPGGRLLESMPENIGNLSDDLQFRLHRHTIKTKDYPDGQQTFTAEFYRDTKRLLY